eukprot:2286152-Amphidinium_carterae.1
MVGELDSDFVDVLTSQERECNVVLTGLVAGCPSIASEARRSGPGVKSIERERVDGWPLDMQEGNTLSRQRHPFLKGFHILGQVFKAPSEQSCLTFCALNVHRISTRDEGGPRIANPSKQGGAPGCGERDGRYCPSSANTVFESTNV